MLACLLEAAGTGFGRVFGLPNGFAGAPRCETVELSDLMAADAGEMRAGLARTPGAWLGLSSGRPEPADFARVLALMRARDSHHLVGMGGGGTMAALAAFHAFAAASDWPLAVAGAPNTIKNDIESVEFSPGFASAARFLALAVRDIDRDLRAMAGGERVVLVEVSGGATGWLAATAVAFRADYDDPPHLVLTPERDIDREALASHIARQRDLFGRALVVANEQEDSVTGLPRRRISLGPLLRAHSARLSPADLDLARATPPTPRPGLCSPPRPSWPPPAATAPSTRSPASNAPYPPSSFHGARPTSPTAIAIWSALSSAAMRRSSDHRSNSRFAAPAPRL